MTAAAVAAVAVAAVAVVFGVSNGSMRDQLSQAQDSSQQIAAVLTARDATMMTGAVKGGGTVTIVMSHSTALVFTAADLHVLPAARGYELWLIGPAGARPVTMLPPVRHDMTGPVMAAGLHPGDHLALTAEPAGRRRPPHRPDDARSRPVNTVQSRPATFVVGMMDEEAAHEVHAHSLHRRVPRARAADALTVPEAPSIESWLDEMEGRGVLLHGDRLQVRQRRHHGAGPPRRTAGQRRAVRRDQGADRRVRRDRLRRSGRGHRGGVEAPDGLLRHHRGPADRGESLRRRRARLRSSLNPLRLIPMYRAMS